MAKLKTAQRKRQNAHCCGSISLIKCMLHIFNVIFLISGIAVFSIGLWTILTKLQYASLLSTATYTIGAYALTIAGMTAILSGTLGCFGIYYEQKATILCYVFLLVFVFLMELLVGGLAYIYETHIEEELRLTLNTTFLKSYGIDETRSNAIDEMQQNYQCCGALRFEDWQYSDWLKSSGEENKLRPRDNRKVPDSCCLTLTDNECGKSDSPSNIPYTGCIYQMSDEIRKHLNVLGAVGLGICVIHIIGMILSCCLYIKLKDPGD